MAFDAHGADDGVRLHGAAKLAFMSDMFDRLVPTYDVVNLLISLGQTTVWRLLALGWQPRTFAPGVRVLDVGCGTGWVSWFLSKRYTGLQVTGLDCSRAMLAEAERRLPQHVFTYGDVCKLPYPSGAFQVVTTVFTLRNFPDLVPALHEMTRVCAPGGTLLILDAFPPRAPLMRALVAFWMNNAVPLLARLFTRDAKAYRYLAASIQQTVDVDTVAGILRAAGCQVEVTRYSFGAAARVFAQKKRTE